MQRTRHTILAHLRDQGSATVQELSERVGLTPVTVRHHLKVLKRQGRVEAFARHAGRGRPRLVYRLTPAGAQPLLAGRYAHLAAALLDTLAADEPGAGARFFEARAESLAAAAPIGVAGSSVEGRLDRVVAVLAEEGFTARWERHGAEHRIHVLGCPYEDLGAAHPEVCRLDAGVIDRLVPGTAVRERWRLDGDAGCMYRVSAAAPAHEPGEAASSLEDPCPDATDAEPKPHPRTRSPKPSRSA